MVRRGTGNFSFSTLGGLLAIVLWSTTFAVARSLSEQVGPLTAAASVYLVGGFLCFLRRWWRRIPLGQLGSISRKYLFGCGFLFVLYTVFIYLAVGLARDREQVLEVALLNYLWPAATILFALVLLGQRASLMLLPGTVLALAGVFLVMTQDAQVSWASFWQHLLTNPAAFLLALAAALAWALYSNLARRWSRPESGGAAELFIAGTGVVLLAMRLFTTEPARWTLRAILESVVLGAVTALAYALWDGAMRKGNLLLVAACSYFTPLLSTLVSCIYLKVTPGPRLWLGCVLLVTGSLVSWRSLSGSPRSEIARADGVAVGQGDDALTD